MTPHGQIGPKVIKWSELSAHFQHPSMLNVSPQNVQWTKVQSYQSWAWHSSGDDHKGSIKRSYTSFSINSLL